MQYLAILGRQPELGLVELESLLGSDSVESFGDAALLDKPLNINNLGGTLKLARVISRIPYQGLSRLSVEADTLPLTSGKTNFGVSVYGHSSFKEVEAFGLTLKKALKSRGSVRLVTPTRPATELSTAQLKFNKIPAQGFELIIMLDGKEAVIAQTEQIQDIDAYAARDQARPARSAKVGMLPPKLAQILINSAGSGGVYDPFCGTGVVLQEALLMGHAAWGSDIDPTMVAATKTNLEWLATNHNLDQTWQVENADAKTAKLPGGAACIVSEGYLGPNLTRHPTLVELNQIKPPLLELFAKTLANFSGQQPPGASLTICVPAWQTNTGWQTLPLLDHLPDLGYTLKRFTTAKSDKLIYARPDQVVGRQILILRKN